MPAPKKKPQLDPLVRESIAMLWAYNGVDLVLLTFLPDTQQFHEYCQVNRKGFSTLNLGTWFSIKYQRYVKCEARINLLDYEVLSENPVNTRVVDAFVQLCILFKCSNANIYTDEYTYRCPLGTILLSKAQGGGPKHLRIWCSLQKTAWWGNPIFEAIEKEGVEGKTVERNNINHTSEASANKSAVAERDESLTSLGKNGYGRECPTIASSPSNLNSTLKMNQESYNNGASIKVSFFKKSNGVEVYDETKDSNSIGSRDKLAKESENYTTGKEKEKPTQMNGMDSRKSQYITHKPNIETANDTDLLKRDNVPERTSTTIPTYSEIIRSFDWENMAVGIVVEQVVDRPNKSPVLYNVYPFCSNERYPGELKLSTKRKLYLGQWIRFPISSISPFGDLQDGKFEHQLPMFRTISYLGKIVIECEIFIPSQLDGELRTVCERVQNEQNGSPPTPFIRYIGDEHSISLQEERGVKRWAVLQFTRMEWSPTKGWWDIVHFKNEAFCKFIHAF